MTGRAGANLAAIVRRFGGVLYANGSRALIPGPGHSPRDRSVSLAIGRDGQLLVHCFSPRDDWRAVRRQLLGDDPALSSPALSSAVRPARAPRGADDRVARARRLWAQGRAISGTPAEAYLYRRGVRRRLPGPEAIRFHPALSSLEDSHRRPALLAAIRSRHGAVQGVEATLLTGEGRRAALATPRRTIGRMAGGAAWLARPGPFLLVAEGMVSALAAAEIMSLPAFAALSAHNLARFEPPSGVARLVIAADPDRAGEAAAAMLVQLLGEHRCDVVMPPSGRRDWDEPVDVRA